MEERVMVMVIVVVVVVVQAVSILHALGQQRMHTHQREQLSCFSDCRSVSKPGPRAALTDHVLSNGFPSCLPARGGLEGNDR